MGNILKRILRAYIWLTAILGTLIIFLVCASLIQNRLVPTDIPVPLGNGFIYIEHPGMENDTRLVVDEDGNVVINRNVEALSIHGKTIYGYRHLSTWLTNSYTKYVYFVCDYGDDCSDNQNYSDIEFKSVLEERNLPPFKGSLIQSRFRLLRNEYFKRLFTFSEPPAIPLVKEEQL